MISLLSLLFVPVTIFPAGPVSPANSSLPAPVILTISAARDTVTMGQEIRLHVALKNSSDHDIIFKKSPGDDLAERFYEIHVTDANGNEVPASDYGRAARARQLAGSVVKVRVKPGDMIEGNAWLGKLFVFKGPGDFVVQVFLPASDDPEYGTIASNKIAIKIAPRSPGK